jgi:hypothetical protein
MKETNKANRYHVKTAWLEPIEVRLQKASVEELEKWAHDPNCIEMEACTKALAARFASREKYQAAQAAKHAVKQKELQDNPFDPRTEISADAIHIASRIVKHLWIIFVLLPFVLALLYVLVIVGFIRSR